MVDYYSLLLRAVTAPGAGDAHWRRGIYDRARRMLASRLRALRPPPPMAEIAAEEAALEAAIDRIESELSWTEHGEIAPDARTHDRFGDIDAEPWSAREQGLVAAPSRLSRGGWIVVAVLVAALGAGGYVAWLEMAQKSTPPSSRAEAQNASPPVRQVATASNGELAPGIDGGTPIPTCLTCFAASRPSIGRCSRSARSSSIRLQHYLYLIQPNNVALRYGIAVGANAPISPDCGTLRAWRNGRHGSRRRICSIAFPLRCRASRAIRSAPACWSSTTATRASTAPTRRRPSAMPSTFGCIRLVNDDIVDLYGRVKVSTPVVIN